MVILINLFVITGEYIFNVLSPTGIVSLPCTLSTLILGEESAVETIYTCSMHPQIKQPEFGLCPICGMDLIPSKPEESAESKTYNSLLKKICL